MESDLAQQQEELEALEAIFTDDFKQDSLSANAYTFTLNLDTDQDVKSPRTLTLTFYLPPNYPQTMPVYQVHSVYCGAKKIDKELLESIDQGFHSLFTPGQVVLFEWIDWLKDYVEEHIPLAENQKEEEQKSDEEIESVFVAHVAKVVSVAQVNAVLGQLLQNKKIAKATHNIMAYRIALTDGAVLQDNDDDGETAAGGRLLHLMQILQVENVVVVVSRWFGGIHLGPDRFKDINNIARTALEEQGFVKQKANQNKKKK
ncbi:ribosomal protein S5 domain 2-type protein [Sporodiniella umbellata]|nr:ribosomal protein S5 domain 2-type protein [Sporodiniella umbellata]